MAVVAAAKAARGRRKAKSWDYCAEVVVQFFCGPEREGGERREREREREPRERVFYTCTLPSFSSFPPLLRGRGLDGPAGRERRSARSTLFLRFGGDVN